MRWISKNPVLSSGLMSVLLIPLIVFALNLGESQTEPSLADIQTALKQLQDSVAELRQEKLPDFSSLVEHNGQAVVNISTVQQVEKRAGRSPEEMEDFQEFFRRFFGEEFGGRDFGADREPRSLGSGFIIEQDGYILTNAHVVRKAKEIIVKLSDQRQMPAKLIGQDDESDLAVLKIEGKDLPVVTLGSSEQLKVGEWVLAIGSPFGFERSATAGIVSAKGRSLQTERYIPFIQTDVAINPGNSGGPLFNLKGEVVGVNAQILSRTGGYMGVSFAIPIDVAVEVVKQLKDSGKVLRGWLGVSFQEITSDLAKSFGLADAQGALVSSLVEGSPAEKAGIKIGDVILRYDGHDIHDAADLPHLVGPTRPGKKVEVEVLREGKKKTIDVVIAELPAEYASSRGAKIRERGEPDAEEYNRLGVQVRDLTTKERASTKVEQGGTMVVGVEPGSPASHARLLKDDIIVEFNREAIKNTEHLNHLATAAPKDKPLAMLVKRGDGQLYVVVRFENEAAAH